jgi:ElaA protein
MSPHVLHAIFKLRGDVFVVEQDCPYPDLDGRDAEPGAEQFWVEVDGDVVACLRRLREADGTVRIGRLATRVDHRGEGLADALVDAALAGVDVPVVLDAQVQLEDWYARLGFVRSGPAFVEDGIPHIPMQRGARPSP